MKKKKMVFEIIIENKMTRKQAEKMMERIMEIMGLFPGQKVGTVLTEKLYLEANPLPKNKD
jgi:hypothetical protein